MNSFIQLASVDYKLQMVVETNLTNNYLKAATIEYNNVSVKSVSALKDHIYCVTSRRQPTWKGIQFYLNTQS